MRQKILLGILSLLIISLACASLSLRKSESDIVRKRADRLYDALINKDPEQIYLLLAPSIRNSTSIPREFINFISYASLDELSAEPSMVVMINSEYAFTKTDVSFRGRGSGKFVSLCEMTKWKKEDGEWYFVDANLRCDDPVKKANIQDFLTD